MFNIGGRMKLRQENRRVAMLCRQSDLNGALEAAGRAQNLAAQIFGTAHPDYALSLNNFASILFKLGSYGEAEPILAHAADILRNAKKTGKEEYAALLNNLGETERLLGKTDEAIQLHEEGVAVRKKIGNPVPYAQSLHNLALAYKAVGNVSKAKVLFEISRNLRMKYLGQNHPDTVRTINALSECNRSVSGSQ
jgi:tetratricopeptide (TPR) repeat protein